MCLRWVLTTCCCSRLVHSWSSSWRFSGVKTQPASAKSMSLPAAQSTAQALFYTPSKVLHAHQTYALPAKSLFLQRGSCQHSHAGGVCMTLHMPGALASLHQQRRTGTEGEPSVAAAGPALTLFCCCCCGALHPARCVLAYLGCAVLPCKSRTSPHCSAAQVQGPAQKDSQNQRDCLI